MTDNIDERGGGGVEVFPCYVEGCDREFTTQRGLEMHHMRVHSGDTRWAAGAKLGARRKAERRQQLAEGRQQQAEPIQPGQRITAGPNVPVRHGDPDWPSRQPGYNSPSPSSPCVLCGKQITEARMGSHLRRVHNAEGRLPKPQRNVAGWDTTRRASEVTRSRLLPQPVATSVAHRRPPVQMPIVRNPEYIRPDEVRYEEAELDEPTIGLNLERFKVIGEDGKIILLVADGVFWKLERLS